MSVKFSIAKRGLLPHEGGSEITTSQPTTKNLRPQLECREEKQKYGCQPTH